MRGTHRILTTIIALLALQLGSLVAPAYACGCGAMVTHRMDRIGVDRETSAVHWDERTGTERIVMRFTVHGDAEKAAWIMPVPHRADVELGDPELFDELARLTAPERRPRDYFWPRGRDWPFSWGETDGAGAAAPGAAGGPGVGVVGRERLGPFDVARLTATDPAALGDWLHRNGFELSDRLEEGLRPYVERKWEYVAVRLAPAKPGEPLRGELDPLRITFTNDRPVYPMRLSRLATTPQSLGLYVLAGHRTEPKDAIGGDRPEVLFAGAIDEPAGAVADLTGPGRVFLTAVDQSFPEPARIDDDHELVRAAADTPYREVIWRDRLWRVGGVPVWVLTMAGTLVLLVAGGFAVARARNARPAAPSTGVRSGA
ncbi:DUF2330 domain-containing protein [Streptomyces roseicoloratus]|uniref:DUF2330 domain-containing protein n=1 Tax=Streptomyces roseicoloratus TaxID=2508722 RepID=A0ABY9S2J8_9ACTN|nr:DUF2330 domain-containing protein [Streptomyces roseicoloratus]WMX47280.1 DUF2330 domain-containing protein [Streptomyces roseicoloratus]